MKQLIVFFQDHDLLAEFLMNFGGWNVTVPKHKPAPEKQASLGKYSIYRHVPEHVADQFREYWPGHRCPIPVGQAFLLSYLIRQGKTNWEIVRLMRVSRATVFQHRQRYRQKNAMFLPQ